jgi:hypothetical protein
MVLRQFKKGGSRELTTGNEVPLTLNQTEVKLLLFSDIDILQIHEIVAQRRTGSYTLGRQGQLSACQVTCLHLIEVVMFLGYLSF